MRGGILRRRAWVQRLPEVCVLHRGGLLVEFRAGDPRPYIIMCVSGTFTPAQLGWSTIMKECFAVWATVRKLRHSGISTVRRTSWPIISAGLSTCRRRSLPSCKNVSSRALSLGNTARRHRHPPAPRSCRQPHFY
jgi:hypothetical protein